MDDGTVVDTKNASQSWDEQRRSNGRNLVSVNTGSEWTSETLHRSRKGRYWIEHTSRIQGHTDGAEWISERRAAAWLILNDEEIPEDLAEAADEVAE